jgi:hypothetical protein
MIVSGPPNTGMPAPAPTEFARCRPSSERPRSNRPPEEDGPRAISAETIDFIEHYVPAASGDNYFCHVTIGLAKLDDLRTIEAEQFEPFTFSPAGLSIYQLGNDGTAAKHLKASRSEGSVCEFPGPCHRKPSHIARPRRRTPNIRRSMKRRTLDRLLAGRR